MTSTIDMLYIDALLRTMVEDDKDVVLSRRYYDGKQDVYLTERLEEIYGLHPNNTFRLNICSAIIEAVKSEIYAMGFDTTEKADLEKKTKSQSQWAWKLWLKNRMDAVQGDVYESAFVDRETFVIVDHNYEEDHARFIHNRRFTDLDADGDGTGCWMVYENDDFNQPAVCGVKQWIQTTYDFFGSPTINMRRTLFYPDRIEKWIYRNGWEHLLLEPFADVTTDSGSNTWPIPWVSRDGKSLGIAMIHFRNVGLRSEIWDAIPLQDAINKTLIDALAVDDLTAFQIYAAFGWYPTTDGEPPKADGSNVITIGPGQIVGSKDPTATLDAIKGDSPAPMMDVLKDLIMMAAEITGTPASRFTTTKLIASADTLKEQDAVLKKKAADRKVLFGNAWEACLALARKVENTFGTSVTALDETIDFETIWKDNQSVDEILKKQTLGVPEEQLWVELGYSEEQVLQMKNAPEYIAKVEKALWSAIQSAVTAGCPFEIALRRFMIPEADITAILAQKVIEDAKKQAELAAQANQSPVQGGPSGSGGNPNQVGQSNKFVRPGANHSNPAVIAAGATSGKTPGGK